MAYLKLSSKFGELRLGRDYVSTFWNQASFDAFGYVGLGASVTARQIYNVSRMDNTIGYFAPPGLGGFYGQATVSAAEGGATLDRPGRYVGLRAGYTAGPFNAAFSASAIRFATPFGAGANGVGAVVTAAPGDTQHTFNIAGSWDFGPAKLLGYYDRDELKGYREDMFSVSSVIRFGVSEIHVGYDRSKLKNPALASTHVDQLKASYVYNLSKRTALHATVSQLSNKDGTRLTLSGAAGSTTAGGKSRGAEFGVRHFF